MAESVVKIRIDSKEYDAQLKKCSEALNRYFTTVREGGGTLEHLDEGVLDAVKAIGNMKTQATQSRQQLREMQNALTDLLTQYRSMTDAERATPLGKEMKNSIDTLTERAGVLRDAMDDVQATVRHSASDTRMFDELAGGVQLATEGYQGFIGAANLLGFEVGENVEVIAKLQSAMALSNSVTQIQNLLQKESALMMGVKALQTRAAAAAEALATKNTVAATAAQKAFNLVAKANPYMLLGSAALAAITAIGMFSSSTDEATESQKEFNEALEETKERINEIIAAEDLLSQTRNYLGGLGTGDSLQAEFDRLKREWDALDSERQRHMVARPGNTQKTMVIEGHEESYNKIVEEQNKINEKMQEVNAKIEAYNNARIKFEHEWSKLTNPREIRAAISYFTERFNDLPIGDEKNKKADYYTNVISILKGKLRKLPGGSLTGGGGGGNTTKEVQAVTGSVADLNNQIKILQDEQSKNATTIQMWERYAQAIDEVNEKIKELQRNAGLTQGTTDTLMGMNVGVMSDALSYVDKFSSLHSKPKEEELLSTRESILKNGTLPTLDLSGYASSSRNVNDKNEVKLTDTVSQMAGGISSIASGIESLGVELPKGLENTLKGIQGITSILSGISSIILAIQAITAADAIIPFALGGVAHAAGGYRVPGNFNSGDMLPVAVNSGELILNHAQQGNLAAQLEGGGSMQASSPYVEGENIILGVNHTLARRGQGELVTTAILRRYGLIK